MSQAIVGRWGRSLAVRLPGDVARAVGIGDGERVDIEARDGEVVIRPAAPHFTLQELFTGKSPQQWRAAYASAFDWGPDVGREAVEE